MATRSRIAIENRDGSIESIYCHWDGDLSTNGAILLKHYNNTKKIRKLIALGSLSSLHENMNPPKNSKHSFDTPIENVVVAYHRDRGENLTIDKFISIVEWKQMSYREQYNYIWRKGRWYYITKGNEFIELKEDDCNE